MDEQGDTGCCCFLVTLGKSFFLSFYITVSEGADAVEETTSFACNVHVSILGDNLYEM